MIANQAEHGLLPYHTFDTNPCRKGRSVNPVSSSGLLPTVSMLDSKISPSSSHRAPTESLGSQDSVIVEALSGSQ